MFSGDGVKQLINRLLPPRCVVRTSADNPIRESLPSHLFTQARGRETNSLPPYTRNSAVFFLGEAGAPFEVLLLIVTKT